MKTLFTLCIISFLSLSASAQFVTENVIGTTYISSQSNGCPYNNIYTDQDGTISTVWTFTPDTLTTPTTLPNRGSGYNFYSSSWSAFPSTRLEPVRTGYPNVVVCGSGKEVVVNHNGVGLYTASRPQKGTGTWSGHAFNTVTNDTWSRLAVGGTNRETLHVICNGSGSSNIQVHGQNGPINYYRSVNEGVSWSQQTIIPGIDSSFYLGFGGDDYVLKASGNVVAILVGNIFTDLVLMKSVDNGITWSKNIVETFAVPFYDGTVTLDTNHDGIADTLYSHRNKMDIAIDPVDSTVHVVFTKFRFYDDASTSGSYNYFPYSDSVFYWNDRQFQTNGAELVCGPKDYNGDGVLNLVGLTDLYAVDKPAIGIYDSKPIVFFLSLDERTGVTGNTRHHLYYTYKQFSSWNTPTEVPMPSLALNLNLITAAKDVSFSNPLPGSCQLHYLYFRDTLNYHSNGGGGISQFATSEVVTGTMDACMLINGVNETTLKNNFNVYPNPANEFITIQSAENGIVKMIDASGKQIHTFGVKSTSRLNISELPSGIYHLIFSNEHESISRNVIIRH